MVAQRIADAVMELFIDVVVLSRASRSLNANSPTADHELKMVKLICQEVCLNLPAACVLLFLDILYIRILNFTRSRVVFPYSSVREWKLSKFNYLFFYSSDRVAKRFWARWTRRRATSATSSSFRSPNWAAPCAPTAASSRSAYSASRQLAAALRVVLL